jgi:hypothetical protein
MALAVSAQSTKTWPAEVANLNNDQRPNILLGRHKPASKFIFINPGSGFVPVDIGLPADMHPCVAAHANLA